MELVLRSGRVIRVLWLVVLGLTALSLAGQAWKLGHGGLESLVDLVYVDSEANLPTWYSSATLGLCAGLLAVIAAVKAGTGAPFLRHWRGLSAVFLFLSLDEMARLHERVGNVLHKRLHTEGFLRFAWVIPGALCAAAVGAAYLGFLRHLPARDRRRFVAAGLIYVIGTLGVNMLGGKLASLDLQDGLTYVLATHLEEFMEMAGVVLFLRALLDHLSDALGARDLRVRVRPG